MAKELPILFTVEMVKAIREGRKTVTRRVIKIENPGFYKDATLLTDGAYRFNGYGTADFKFLKPRYNVGDLLWVKEGWRCTGGGTLRNIIYRADGDTPISFCGIDDGREPMLHVPEPYWAEWDRLVYETDLGCDWRNPLFMPKWVAWSWLEVVSVRPERLQDITDEDAIREGFKITGCDGRSHGHQWNEIFRPVWDSINAKRGYPWASNPWVWRIEFKGINRKP